MYVCVYGDGEELLSFTASSSAQTQPAKTAIATPLPLLPFRGMQMLEGLHFNKKKKTTSSFVQVRAACAGRPIQFPLVSGNVNVM